MNDHYNHTVDPRDLTKRLNRIQKSHSIPNDGDYITRLSGVSRAGTTSSETSSTISRLPTLRKSATSSTTSSDQVSRLEVMRSIPYAKTTKESVEVGRGEFSKPRLGRRSRRESNESAKSVPEFQYYGRHANTWLFNDFSVTDTVKKGWGKVFSGKRED